MLACNLPSNNSNQPNPERRSDGGRINCAGTTLREQDADLIPSRYRDFRTISQYANIYAGPALNSLHPCQPLQPRQIAIMHFLLQM